MNMQLQPVFGLPLTIAFSIVIITVPLYCLWQCVTHRTAWDSTPTTWLRRVAMSVLATGIMLQPTIAVSDTTQAVQATNVIIALDVSSSMQAKDARYPHDGNNHEKTTAHSRFEVAKQIIRDIIQAYPHAQFTAISFGAQSSLDIPLTPDTQAVNMWLQSLHTECDNAAHGSTLDAPLHTIMNVAEHIANEHPHDTNLLYYISDGEQTTKRPRKSFSPLRAWIQGGSTITIGTTQGATIPNITADGSEQGNVLDPATNQPGISHANPTAMAHIADEFSGTTIHADQSQWKEQQSLVKLLEHDHSQALRIIHNGKSHTVNNAVVWPLVILLALCLLWELVNYIRTAQRYLV